MEYRSANFDLNNGQGKNEEPKSRVSMNIPDSDKPRVVVIGGGFAGVEIVKTLGRDNPFQVVLLDKNNFHNFQPLMYQVATAGLEPDAIAAPLRRIFKGYKDFYFRMAKVNRIFPSENCINTSIGRLKYDFLVIATGSKTNYYGMENVKKNSVPMKKIPEALDLRSKILQNFEQALLVSDPEVRSSLLDVVIVGGGPTGVELAGAIAELKKHVLPNDLPELDFTKMDIYLIEAAPQLLNGMSANASKKALKYLDDFGVHVMLNTTVKNYDGYIVEFGDGKKIVSQSLIWAAGVMGSIIEGIDPEVIKGNRYHVDLFCRIKGYENLYCIGDVAGMYTPEIPRGHPMVAQVAIQQGRLVAKNLLRMHKNKTPKPFKYNDKGSMATIGRNRAVVDLPNWKFAGVFAWLVWMFVHIISLVGFRNKVAVFFNWVWNYFTYDRATRLIIRPWVKHEQKKEKLERDSIKVRKG
ncbi:NAD(P)/FAD-dependent oxidoreductase [Cytophagaceae bacterium ABcell3]|nr:NAD(P)/FAD-dependent oxidoreductase [Cytophagaceae bacterium ABcell3]